jgi:hypothetical protein
MSTNYFHRNGPLVSHVADQFFLFVANLRKCQYFVIAKSFDKNLAKMLGNCLEIFVSRRLFCKKFL